MVTRHRLLKVVIRIVRSSSLPLHRLRFADCLPAKVRKHLCCLPEVVPQNFLSVRQSSLELWQLLPLRAARFLSAEVVSPIRSWHPLQNLSFLSSSPHSMAPMPCPKVELLMLVAAHL